MNALLTKNWLAISMGIALVALVVPLALLCPQQFGLATNSTGVASEEGKMPVELPDVVRKACRPHTAA